LQSKPRFRSIHRPGEARELFNALVIREHPRDPRFQLMILGQYRSGGVGKFCETEGSRRGAKPQSEEHGRRGMQFNLSSHK